MKTTMRTILGLAAVALALATGGREASADIIYDLSGVTFFTPPGGTATGTFTTNDARTALVTFDITTSTVSGFPGFEYTPATAIGNGALLPTEFFLEAPARALILVFAGGLTATGATLSAGSRETTGAPDREIVSGSAVAVPEPSSLLLGGVAAAAGLGLRTWRRRAACRVG
jgi:hypothetical protein